MKPQIMPMQAAVEYRQLLLRRKSELLRELRADRAGLAELHSENPASAIQDEEVLERLTGLDYQELTQVDDALDRLEAGTYGTCRQCARLIGTRRMDAIPWAIRCRSCEERSNALSGAA